MSETLVTWEQRRSRDDALLKRTLLVDRGHWFWAGALPPPTVETYDVLFCAVPEPKGDGMAEATEEQFKAQVEEVAGDLGVAILTVATGTEPDAVREAWRTLGRSFAELVEMDTPR